MGEERDRCQVRSEQLGQAQPAAGAEKEPDRLRALQGPETEEAGTLILVLILGRLSAKMDWHILQEDDNKQQLANWEPLL